MPHNLELIVTLAGALGVALALGLLTHKLHLSPIVGYLFAGVLLGPFTPGFVANVGLAEQLSEIGVVLLMFGVGLHFHADDLLKVWKIALPGALAQIAVATGLGVLVTTAFGWTWSAGVVFGLAIAVASTVVLIRVLSDHDALQSPAGHVAVGWLVVEDIFTVLVLVVLPALAAPSPSPGTHPVVAGGAAVLRMAAFFVLVFWLGGRALPWFLRHVARTNSRELFTLSVLVVALGIAVGSAQLFGVSMALGAFLAGMIVGRSEFGARAASEALPMRDAFAVLFFASVGMLVDPRDLMQNAGLVLATVAVVLVGKSLTAFVVVRLLGYPQRTAVSVAVALAQIGEFSFILAALGRELGILPHAATQVLVVTAIVTITLNPLLFRLVDPTVRFLTRRDATGTPTPQPAEVGEDASHRAIVVGYGPVGQTVVRLLSEYEVESTVIELNYDTVHALGAKGIRAIHGDAAQTTILESAGIRGVRTLIFAASGSPPEAVIRAARDLNHDLRIFARSTYVREVPASRAAGADVVVAGEAEVALAMAEHLLIDLGATPEQLDRARDRTRQELSQR
jgi:monovalent cation:H+ antiporter-2, CPA2 family